MEDNSSRTPIAWLLLRDGHAVPLFDLSPEGIKDSRKRAVPFPEADLKYRQGLNAIVDSLGFKGDFGDYTHSGWPKLQQFLVDNGCSESKNLFPHERWFGFHFYFGPNISPGRGALAERVFVGPKPAPARVFLGYGVDWEQWADLADRFGLDSRLFNAGEDEDFVPTSQEEAIRFVLTHQTEFMASWSFTDDKLVAGPVEHVIDKTYYTPATPTTDRLSHARQMLALIRAFRFIFDKQPEGWVDLLPFNDRLVVLRAHDGAWDVIWYNLREDPPPQAEGRADRYSLHIQDLPMGLVGENDLSRRLYFRPGAWTEQERHAAEQHFYDRGGSVLDRRMTSEDDLLFRYLADRGILPGSERAKWEGTPPDGFHEIALDGRRLLVSDLITLGEFRRMLSETGYLERRAERDEDWHRANPGGVPDSSPVGASWRDAQAFLAWKERQLGVALRLPSKNELRSMRPFYSERYSNLAQGDFYWENYPPRPIMEPQPDGSVGRVDLPSALVWSEPRFLEPGPEVPEFPPPGGWSSRSRKRWIVDFPPSASWVERLPSGEHSGLTFIDAWDAYEWAQEAGWISGRFWEGAIGEGSWGAYKNVKVCFRIVIELG